MAELTKKLTTEQKTQLSHLLLLGHKRFGPVAQRKPYRDDEDEGGAGAPSILQEHPLLAQQPIGATSDLSHIVSQNREAEKELEKTDEAKMSPELKLQAQKQHEFTHAKKHDNLSRPRPSPLG